jgi:hypothetical protein
MKKVILFVSYVFTIWLLAACHSQMDYAELPTDDINVSLTPLTKTEAQTSFSFDPIIQDSAWRYNENVMERVTALQIPDSILTHISTENLVQLCMEYPFYGCYAAVNNTTEGIRSVMSMFNGFSALQKREDSAPSLLSYYEFMDVDKIALGALQKDTNALEQLFHLTYVEKALSELVSTNFNREDMVILDRICRQKQEAKQRHPEVYGTFDLRMGQDLLKAIEEKGTKASSALMSFIGTVYLQTTYGRTVIAYENSEEFSASDKNSIANYYCSLFPNAEYLGEPTTTYNCHNYAWNMSLGGNAYWLNATMYGPQVLDGYTDVYTDNLENYWLDGRYIVTTESNANRVFYYRGDHSAIRETNGTYVSKWGPLVLMRHAPTDCPPDYYPYYRRYYHDCTFILTCTNMYGELSIGVSEVFWPTEVPAGTSSTSYSWHVYDDKNGDDVIGTWASLQNASADSATISFTKIGSYMVELQRYHPNRGWLFYSLMVDVTNNL